MKAKLLIFLVSLSLISNFAKTPTAYACPPPECSECYEWDGYECVPICGCFPSPIGFSVWASTDDRYVCIDDTVTFSAWPYTWDGDGCALVYSWDFGRDAYDTSEGDGDWEYCRYGSIGDRTVTLNVTRVTTPNSCCSTPRTDSFSRTVTAVKVASLLPDVGTEIDDGDSNPNTKSFAVCVYPGVVTVTATPNPNVPEQCLPGYGTTWGWTLTGGIGTSWVTRTVDRATPGVTTITCTCGSSSKTTKIYIVKVEITEPDENPVTDNNFKFNSANPGVCNVIGTGTTGITDMDPDLIWSTPGISGSTLTSNPPDRNGTNITFTYTTLPSSWVGWKNLYLEHPAVSCMDWQLVEMFFSPDASNNPGGTTPNWYYYWSQTSASSGNHQYDDTTPGYYGYYNGGDPYFYICPPARGYYWTTGHDGIDTFAEICLHENTHKTNYETWWAPLGGYNPVYDQDCDRVLDSAEPALGLDPTKWDTDGDGLEDEHDLAYDAELTWPKGNADSEDWGDPGHRSNQ
jgi:hypothetical protein